VAEPVPAERSIHNRELEGRGLPSRPGNPGTYLGEVDVDGRRYAKFSAEPGTWVSSSMKTMGYDQEYAAKDGYGAYRGLVLGPNGKPLADPDRIRPGDQYLVPERTAPAAPGARAVRAADTAASTGPAAPTAPPRSEPAADRPRARPAEAPAAAPAQLNLRPAPEAAPVPPASRRLRIPDELELAPQERDELERLLNDPSSDALIAEELRWLALDGIEQAMAGRAEQEEFGSGDNTVYAFLNDWVSNRQVPFISAWHNTAMLFRRMLEQVDSGDLDNALLTGRNGYAALADTQAEWNEYTQANLRLGELMIGTAEEIRRTGVVGNLRLAGVGLAGEVYGAGKRLSEFAAGVIGLLVDPGRATYKFLQSLVTVVDTAFQLGRAYGKDPAEFMPKVIDALSRQSRESLERLSRLPPDQQAWEVSAVFGEIEGDLIPMAAANSIAGSLRRGAPAIGSGLEGARVLEGMRGLAVAEGRMVVAGGSPAATIAVADTVQLAGFLSAFAIAAGSGGGGPKEKVVEGEVTKYEDLQKRGKSKELEGHEALPHSLLEDLGLATRRGIGAASRNNPVIALSPKVHAMVGRYQRFFKVFYRSQRVGMTVEKIISLNIKALRGAGVPESVVRDISRQVLRHALNLKIRQAVAP
jgi:hypothetical protein